MCKLAVSWAPPYSDDAIKFGFTKQGCYVIKTLNHDKSFSYITAYENKIEANAFVRGFEYQTYLNKKPNKLADLVIIQEG